MNPDLEDAFGSDDESEDEADDRQRLVRQNTTPAANNSAPPAPGPAAPVAPVAASSSARGRMVGGGNGSDGVFANMAARPDKGNGSAEKDEQPPTYEQAAADSAPPYWETTILAPGMSGLDEIYVDGLPVGSIFFFIWNGMISAMLQLPGFFLTYLLHTTHAAKNGSKAGLGLTLIQYGFEMRDSSSGEPPAMSGPDGYAAPEDPNAHDFQVGDVTGGAVDFTSGEWLSYLLMIAGWFILIKSTADFLQARRHEQLVMQSPDRGLGVAVIAEGESSERVV